MTGATSPRKPIEGVHGESKDAREGPLTKWVEAGWVIAAAHEVGPVETTEAGVVSQATKGWLIEGTRGSGLAPSAAAGTGEEAAGMIALQPTEGGTREAGKASSRAPAPPGADTAGLICVPTVECRSTVDSNPAATTATVEGVGFHALCVSRTAPTVTAVGAGSCASHALCDLRTAPTVTGGTIGSGSSAADEAKSTAEHDPSASSSSKDGAMEDGATIWTPEDWT